MTAAAPLRKPNRALRLCKILVTGAGGFVGAAVVRMARAQGHEVIATGRGDAYPRLARLSGDFRYVRLDLCNAEAVATRLPIIALT
jgi:nucleoside-diphosphate-sugar epimerase